MPTSMRSAPMRSTSRAGTLRRSTASRAAARTRYTFDRPNRPLDHHSQLQRWLVGVVPIEKDGTLGPQAHLVNLPGEPGPDRKQQTSSHPHDAVFDPSGRFIAVPDKGLDRVFVFRLDAASGKLTSNDPPFVATRAGAGPRHIAFHPQMPLAYVINELGSSVTTYRFDAQRGVLQPIQILPSIPANYTGNNTGAEVAIAPSGRVVYVSNRGHDSIAILAV